jgi:formate hydrogenlyase subunit 6/NADH:ubiquinone oxidoreductase subunit I
MDAVRHGKELEWISFTLDYQKCMFCELCVYPCPKDCITEVPVRFIPAGDPFWTP